MVDTINKPEIKTTNPINPENILLRALSLLALSPPDVIIASDPVIIVITNQIIPIIVIIPTSDDRKVEKILS